MTTLSFEYFFRQLQAGMNIDETCFYFADEPDEAERYLGYLPQYDKPYWVGLCDIEDGAEFSTAEELVNAPIYNGKSLKSRWAQVRICCIEGLALDDWLECMAHAD